MSRKPTWTKIDIDPVPFVLGQTKVRWHRPSGPRDEPATILYVVIVHFLDARECIVVDHTGRFQIVRLDQLGIVRPGTVTAEVAPQPATLGA